jgi:hypothetical protein
MRESWKNIALRIVTVLVLILLMNLPKQTSSTLENHPTIQPGKMIWISGKFLILLGITIPVWPCTI